MVKGNERRENITVKELWHNYKKINRNALEAYVAWAFGDSKEMADELAQLVLDGTKTAAASNYRLYELENEALPEVGLQNIILDGAENPVAIVETTAVEVIPFDEISAEHAYLEGEGDRTPAYWREVHEPFFSKELEIVNLEFHKKIPIFCEQFKLVYGILGSDPYSVTPFLRQHSTRSSRQ